MRRRPKVLLSLLLFAVAGGLVLTLGKQAAPFPEGSESASRLLPGPYTVASYDARLRDSSRGSPAHSDYEGSDERVLEVSVWHPANPLQTPQPLVVYSHGFSSSREGGAYLGRHLASYGFVVVAADFPMTHMKAPGGPWVRDVVNQPGDVSFLIDRLLAANADSEHVLHAQIDPDRIGVVGLSLGALTSTLVAYHPEWRDSRVGAVLSIAGRTSPFSKVFFESPSPTPFLMLAGDIDALVPYKANAQPVLNKIPGAQLVTIHGGSHAGFAGSASVLRFMNNPDALACWIVMRNVDDQDSAGTWLNALGRPEQGVRQSSRVESCALPVLPTAINPLRQQMITTVVVRAFFDAVFSRGADERALAQQFLSERLPAEVDNVSYAASLTVTTP